MISHYEKMGGLPGRKRVESSCSIIVTALFYCRKNCSLFQILFESRVSKFKVAHGFRKRNSVTWQKVIQAKFKIKQPMEPIYHLMSGSFIPTMC